MSRVARPEHYVTFAEGAEALREMADDLVKRIEPGRMVSVSVQYSFAGEKDIEKAWSRKCAKPVLNDGRRCALKPNHHGDCSPYYHV